MRRHRVAFFVVFGVLVPLAACGTSAMGVDICNEIESARCTRAAALEMSGHTCTEPLKLPDGAVLDSGVVLDFLAPFADGGTATENAAACIRFYSVACLHGLVTPDVPSSSSSYVVNCVNAINSGSCAVVIDPTGEAGGGACQWLLEAGPPEAGDGGVTDAPVDVDVVVVVDTGTPIVDTGVDVEECIQGFTCNPMP